MKTPHWQNLFHTGGVYQSTTVAVPPTCTCRPVSTRRTRQAATVGCWCRRMLEPRWSTSRWPESPSSAHRDRANPLYPLGRGGAVTAEIMGLSAVDLEGCCGRIQSVRVCDFLDETYLHVHSMFYLYHPFTNRIASRVVLANRP